MRIIAVDDEPLALKNLEIKIKECFQSDEFETFDSPAGLLEGLKEKSADIAILDIHMGEMDGITLAKRVRQQCPTCAVLFLTAYPEYAVEAFSIKASGYLLKPVKTEELQREVEYVRKKLPAVDKKQDRLVIQCFGNFDVFMHGESISFPRSKSKELFAYLIDRRGAHVTMAEIASVLWADGIFDRSRNNQIHTYLHDLIKTLRAVTRDEIILKKRNAVAVDPSLLDCDYYHFLEGDIQAINSYAGEYMTQYWWSEFTTGTISTQKWR